MLARLAWSRWGLSHNQPPDNPRRPGESGGGGSLLSKSRRSLHSRASGSGQAGRQWPHAGAWRRRSGRIQAVGSPAPGGAGENQSQWPLQELEAERWDQRLA